MTDVRHGAKKRKAGRRRYAAAALPVADPDDALLTRREVAQHLRCAVATLERWASIGTGPKFRVIAGKALYTWRSVRDYTDTK